MDVTGRSVSRRGFLALLAGAVPAAIVAPTYFFAPKGGWWPGRLSTPIVTSGQSLSQFPISLDFWRGSGGNFQRRIEEAMGAGFQTDLPLDVGDEVGVFRQEGGARRGTDVVVFVDLEHKQVWVKSAMPFRSLG